MLTVLAGMALSLLVADENAVKQLTAVGQKITNADSYTAVIVRSATGPADAKGDDENDKNDDPWKVEVKRKVPTHYARGADVDLFRTDAKFVVKGGDGKWALLDPAERAKRELPKAGGTSGGTTGGGDDGNGGGEGGKRRKGEGREGREGRGEGKGGGKGEGKGEGKHPEGREPREAPERLRGVDRIFAVVETLPLPHRLLADLDRKISDATREEKDGKVVYVATLRSEAVRELMGMRGGKHGPGEKAGGEKEGGEAAAGKADRPEPDTSGTMRILVSNDVVEKIELDLKAKSNAGDRAVKTRIDLSGVNTTNLVPPAEVTGLVGKS